MKVIVSVQAKQASSRGLIHYIAHSKLDGAREAAGREIFGEESGAIAVEKANSLLNDDTARKRPLNADLHHLVISFKPDDFQSLGGSEKERTRSLKEIARHAMKRFAGEIGAAKLNWAAGIHRNTDNPHIHIAVGKTYIDKNLEKKYLSKIPRNLLPHHELNEKGEKVFAPGFLIEAAQKKLEEIQQSKERSAHSEKNKTQIREKLTRTAGNRLEINRKNDAAQRPQEPNVKSDVEREREILARAILAKYNLEKTREKLDALENYGDRRRFRIFDPVSEKQRYISLFDLETRAERSAAREIKKQRFSDPLKKEELRKTLIGEEIKKNTDGIKRIKTILHHLVVRENRELRKREEDYKSLKAPLDLIRQNYRRENKKLPAPLLSGEELELVQAAALEKKDFRAAHYFERVRLELSREREIPSRSKSEIERLKAARALSELRLLHREKQLKIFEAKRHVFPVELDGKKTTLSQIDESIEKALLNEQKFTGKISKALGKIGLFERSGKIAELEETKNKILEIWNQKHGKMAAEINLEKTLLKTLNDFYEHETNPEKELIQAKSGTETLAEIETLAARLKLPEVYRENWLQQKQFIEASENKDKSDSGRAGRVVAGRALARQILSEIELSRCREELDSFKKHRDFTRFEIINHKTGEAKYVSLAEVKFDFSGSLFDQTLEYFLENREKRNARRALEQLTKEKHRELKENLKSAKTISKFAAEAARDYQTRSIFGAVKFNHDPIFTPQELMTIELRIHQTTSKSEAKNLQKILDSADHSKANNLPIILSSFMTENERSGPLEMNSEKSLSKAIQPQKDEVKKEPEKSNMRDNKTEIHNQEKDR